MVTDKQWDVIRKSVLYSPKSYIVDSKAYKF